MPACLLDSNVWLAAAFAEYPAHAVSRRVLCSASPDEPALWCRATQQSFLRLASTPVITQAYGVPKTSNGDAWAALQTFLALPQVDVIDEPPEMGRTWCQLGAIEQGIGPVNHSYSMEVADQSLCSNRVSGHLCSCSLSG